MVFVWLYLLIAGACLAVSFAGDAEAEKAGRAASEEIHRVASKISHWMDWPEVLGLPLGIGLILWVRKKPLAARSALSIALAAGVAGLAGTVVRTATGRARPSTTVVQGWYGMQHEGKWIVGQHAFASFPSGHTSTVAGAAGALWATRRRWAWLGFVAVIVVAWGRIFAVAHHLSDVTAAAALGLPLGYWTAAKIVRRWQKPD
jgi:membrane-associated phospholipid phosphatase